MRKPRIVPTHSPNPDVSAEEINIDSIYKWQLQHQGKVMNLRRFDLTGKFLRAANLSLADLRDANLTNTYLNFANLEGADLRDAALQSTKLYKANMKDAIFSSEAQVIIAKRAGALIDKIPTVLDRSGKKIITPAYENYALRTDISDPDINLLAHESPNLPPLSGLHSFEAPGKLKINKPGQSAIIGEF